LEQTHNIHRYFAITKILINTKQNKKKKKKKKKKKQKKKKKKKKKNPRLYTDIWTRAGTDTSFSDWLRTHAQT